MKGQRISYIKEENEMSKNILIISTSPRRGGNSETLADEFMRGANDADRKSVV